MLERVEKGGGVCVKLLGNVGWFLAQVLALHRAAPVSPHLEVETYTWDVLPEALTGDGLEAAVARELDWVRERLV